MNLADKLCRNYKGWDTFVLGNQWLEVFIAPQLGGRTIQVQFQRDPFFFVNPGLEGVFPGNPLAPAAMTWQNFGGEKIWPAPQGWGSPDLWPGPPDPVLDSGSYQMVEGAENDSEIVLKSPVDSYTGLQICKTIRLDTTDPRIYFSGQFINFSDVEREWSVWPVFQFDTPDLSTPGRYIVSCPVNPVSKWPAGYKVMHGLVNNPQFRSGPGGVFFADYQYLVGKAGLDSPGDWVAFTDRTTGNTCVACYGYETGSKYPEDTSVQIWTQGKGAIFSRGKVSEFSDNVRTNPPYLEIELLSPLKKIRPGESIRFDYDLRVCCLPPGVPVIEKNCAGVVGVPLKITRQRKSLVVAGKYGVFSEGYLILRIVRKSGEFYPEEKSEKWSVSPAFGIAFSKCFTDLEIDMKEELTAVLYFESHDQTRVTEFDRSEIWVP